MRIFLTGARGFVGQHVLRTLLAQGHSVRHTDLKPHKGPWSESSQVDITDLTRLEKIFRNDQPIDAVIHLAAQPSLQTSWKDAVLDAKVNILGTINLLGLCQRYKVKRFVFASTSAVYAPKTTMPYMEDDLLGPQTPYGVSKVAAEHYVRISGLSYAILRLGNVYGPGQVPLGESILIARALAHIYQGEPFVINGDGEQRRDFVYVRDVARAFADSVKSDVKGTFNIATGDSDSVNYVLRHIYYQTHFAGLGELIGTEDPAWKAYWKYGSAKPGELREVVLSCELAKRDLGWLRSTGIHLGRQKTIEAWPKE